MELGKWSRAGESQAQFEERMPPRSRMSVTEALSLCQQLGLRLQHAQLEVLHRSCLLPPPQYAGGTGKLVSLPPAGDQPGPPARCAYPVCIPVLHGVYVDPAVVFHELGHWVLELHQSRVTSFSLRPPQALAGSIQEAYACALAVALAHTAGALSWSRPELFRRVLNVHRSPTYVTHRDILDLLKNFLYQHLDDLLAQNLAYPFVANQPLDRCLRFLEFLVFDVDKFLALANMATPPSPDRTALDVWMGTTRGWPGVDPGTGEVVDLDAALAALAQHTDDMPQLELLRAVLEWVRLPAAWRRGFPWTHPQVAAFLDTWIYDYGFVGMVEDSRLLVKTHGPADLIAALDTLVNHVAAWRHLH